MKLLSFFLFCARILYKSEFVCYNYNVEIYDNIGY